MQTPIPITDPAVAIAAAVAAALAQSAASQQYTIAIIGTVGTLLGLIIQGAIAIVLKRMGEGVIQAKDELATSIQETKVATEQIIKSTAANAESTEKIHVAVNSERAATKEEIRLLKNEVLDLSKVIAKLEQHKEDTAAAAAAKDRP